MVDHRTEDVRHHGGIDLPTLQKYINFHFSVSEDLFGSERSTNAANYYTAGLKGRYQETRLKDDHSLADESYTVTRVDAGRLVETQASALSVVNERLRDDYIADCQRGVDRWNRLISKCGVDFKFSLPHRAFHRQIGEFSDIYATPEGQLIDEAQWLKRASDWLPSDEDQAYVSSLMVPVTEPGEFANWIAPPRIGINEQPVEFPYVDLC
jgi:benzoyl-CoA 2,3-dioxygenase component B